MSTLAEIKDRAAAPNKALARGIHYTHVYESALEASQEDVAPLVAAVEAVEALHSKELGGTPDGSFADVCGGCANYYPCPTLNAIAEALS